MDQETEERRNWGREVQKRENIQFGEDAVEGRAGAAREREDDPLRLAAQVGDGHVAGVWLAGVPRLVGAGLGLLVPRP